MPLVVVLWPTVGFLFYLNIHLIVGVVTGQREFIFKR